MTSSVHMRLMGTLVLVLCANHASARAVPATRPTTLPTLSVLRVERPDVIVEAVPPARAKFGSPIEFQFRVDNRSAAPLQCFYWNESRWPFAVSAVDADLRAVPHTLEGAEMVRQKNHLRSDLLPPSVSLDPGQALTARYDLSQLFRFPGPGLYVLTVHFCYAPSGSTAYKTVELSPIFLWVH